LLLGFDNDLKMADRVQMCEKCDAYAEETWSLKGGQGMGALAATGTILHCLANEIYLELLG